MTNARKIARWFHEREGELLTIDETPFDRQELVQLTNDSVDPIQQVLVDGERYYGVISYNEHDGWYEYTRWDDALGEVSIGVCANCVKQAESVDKVARTLGNSTDVSRQKIQQHYAESHTEKPASVETGATLLSGTTVAGNEAIHVGMDGSGSGVDADFLQGSEAIREGNFVVGSKTNAGGVQSKFASPSAGPDGIGVDSSDCIWHAAGTAGSIYELNQTGNIQSGFAAPSSFARGLGVDSSDCLWHADATADSIYELNQTGTVQSQFSTPSQSPTGVGLDSSDCIWHADENAESIYELNHTGNIQSGFAAPSSLPNGVGVDSSGCLWNSDVGTLSIYELNQTGTVQSKLASQDNGPIGLGVGSNGCIWLADSSADSIYEIAKANTVSLQ